MTNQSPHKSAKQNCDTDIRSVASDSGHLRPPVAFDVSCRCIQRNGISKLFTERHHVLKHIGSIDENFNHFSTIGLYGGPAHYDVSIRQAAIEAFVTSSFKIFLTQTFPRCGATCYILPSRAMSQLFNGVNFLSLR